jgi:hypothetical protein
MSFMLTFIQGKKMTLSLKEQFQQKSLTLDEEISALEQANSLEKMLATL